MNIAFRHGPLDGETKFLRAHQPTIVVLLEHFQHEYIRTPRSTPTGAIVYQYLGVLLEAKEIQAA